MPSLSSVRTGLVRGYEEAGGGLERPPTRGRTPEQLHALISSYPVEVSDRFGMTFASLVAIAEASRSHYGHSQLSDEEVLAYLGHSITFVNSWSHY